MHRSVVHSLVTGLGDPGIGVRERERRLRQFYNLVRRGHRLREHTALVGLRELYLDDSLINVLYLGDRDGVAGGRHLAGEDGGDDLRIEIYGRGRWRLL